MQPFDTTTYELLRKPDNTIVRVFGNWHEEPELTQEQHQYNVEYHTQVASNAQAQLDKVAAFELDNPAVEVETVEPEDETVEFKQGEEYVEEVVDNPPVEQEEVVEEQPQEA